MEISISIKQKSIEINPDELRKKTEQILSGLGCDPETIISVSLVDAVKMSELNLEYRGIGAPTNVLSFSQLEGEPAAGLPHLWGDVVICADRARDDASELGYTHEEMVVYLLIHGILHLAGYDHTLPQDERTMNEKVQDIFNGLYPSPE
jgi:probable rRNA maturation factor